MGTALVISAGAHAWLNRAVLSNRVVVWIGLISFPLYLWHWSLLSFALIVQGDVPPLGLRIALILSAFVLAWGTYRLVEIPIRFDKRSAGKKSIVLLASMLAAGLAGLFCYERDGVPSRANANMVMNEREIAAERQRYWSGAKRLNMAGGSPRILVFGDSQAFDIFSALRNDPRLGLTLHQSSYQCSGFFAARAEHEGKAAVCRKAFDDLLDSPDLRAADVLIHAHGYYVATPIETYGTAVGELLRVNPRLKIVIFGNKPMLGNTWISINAITRKHRSPIGMNEFLERMMVNPDEGNRYSKAVAASLGAEFVDVQGTFCQGGCPFYFEGRFSYFDQNHWTEAGAKIFYEKLSNTAVYRTMVDTR
jgi:hypothetical protein